MSWDIFVQDFPSDAKSIEDIPDDFKPGSIGKTSDIIERIKEVVPTADFSNPAWGTIDGDGWSIEVNIDEERTATALHSMFAEATQWLASLVRSCNI